MSVCIEQNHHNNFSQSLSTCIAENKSPFGQPLTAIKYWMERSRQRKHLAILDDRMLEDIGLSREQVLLEIIKPFWK